MNIAIMYSSLITKLDSA